MISDCILQTFASPNFSGLMPGARFDAAAKELSAAELPCCKGSGVRLVEESGRGTLVRCDLKARFSMTQDVMQKYAARWDLAKLAIEKCATGDEQRVILQRLAEYGECSNLDHPKFSKGLGFKAKVEGPGAVWWAAVAAAWRFGLKVHVVDMEEARRGPILPDKVWQNDGRRGAVFVDRVLGLWDPGLAQEFETLIGFCCRAGVPLWISRIEGDSSKSKAEADIASATSRSAFTRRLKTSRNKPWDSWIRKDVRDKLIEAHEFY